MLLHQESPGKLAVCFETNFQVDFVQGTHETLIETGFYDVAKEILFIYLFIISSLFKVDFNVGYKKPINVNNNTAYISINKLLSKNDNNKTEYLIVRQNQQVPNRLYITYMGNQASTFLFFV